MRKTLLDICKSVCGELSLTVPVNVVSSTDLLTTQVYYLVQAACDELIQYHDWQALTKVAEIPLTGTETYQLPSDVQRIIPGSFTYTNGTVLAATAISGSVSPGSYQNLVNPVAAVSANYLTFQQAGDVLKVYPSSLNGGTMKFVYISNKCIFDGTVYKDSFSQDSDVCLFDSRLVVALVKLKVLQAKGLDSTFAVNDFNFLLEVNKQRDVPAPVLSLDAAVAPVARDLPYTVM